MTTGIEEAMMDIGTKHIGKSIIKLDHVDSTNARAASLAKDGAAEGTVIMAEVQNAGYGRLDRQWISPKGGLWLSLIIRPDMEPRDATIITLMGACAVAEALKSISGIDATIKWPNDVLISQKKVCGILTEMRTRDNAIDFVILGIGINANFHVNDLPEELRETATTLRMECGGDIPLQDLCKSLLINIDVLYEKVLSGKTRDIIERWKSRNNTLGQHVRITTLNGSIEGTAVDLDESGALIVKAEDGEMRNIIAGDCVHLSPMK